ncbi:hypothetical protein FXO38_12943 [Capsicum annuum]|nr:hypothetical protein FXO38_12943 [Capsicum annuum]
MELNLQLRNDASIMYPSKAKILSVVKNQHLLLCTLLIGNSLAMKFLPIFLDKLIPSWVAILIIPQSICTHYGLTVGATVAPIVQLLLWLFFLIAYPISKVLDWMLGKGHAALLRRAELKTFVDFHGNELIFYVPREKSELGHWILGVFDFTDWCIYVDDYNRTRRGDKVVQKVMLPYQTLIPYFLKKVNFYLEKGIAKSENDTLSIKMVDELPQQTQCDCGAFVWASAEYVIHGRDIPKEIDISQVCMSYGTLLWDYGKRKLEAGIKDNTIEKVGRLFGKEKRKRTHQK